MTLRILEFKKDTRKPSEEMVEFCEKLLACAKTGQLLGIVCVWQYDEGGTDFKWVLDEGCRPIAVVGQLAAAQHKLLSSSTTIYREPPPIPSSDEEAPEVD